MELWPEGVFSKVMRPNSNPRCLRTRKYLHVNVLGKVLKKFKKTEDRLIIMPYQYYHVHTDCPILSMNSWTIKHVFTVLFRPNHVHETRHSRTVWSDNHRIPLNCWFYPVGIVFFWQESRQRRKLRFLVSQLCKTKRAKCNTNNEMY